MEWDKLLQSEQANQIADALKEEGPAREKIFALIERCGLDFAQDILNQTLAVEEQGGLMVRDRSRRRTIGGVFFYLTKERLKREKRYSDLDYLFPRSPEDPALSPPHAPTVFSKLRPRPRPVRGADNTDGSQKPSSPLPVRRTSHRPDQVAILKVIERHIGNPPDLSRSSVNPETGTVTLSFHFPDVAWEYYGEKLEAATAEVCVPIIIHPQPNQQALMDFALSVLPASLKPRNRPSLFTEKKTVRVFCEGNIGEQQDIVQAQVRFHQVTGWNLDITLVYNQDQPPSMLQSSTAVVTLARMSQHQAVQLVRQEIGEDCYKVGAHEEQHLLMVHVFFPQVMTERYTPLLPDLQARTGWKLAIHPLVHQGKLIEFAQQAVQALLTRVGTPSLYHDASRVVVRYLPDREIDASALAQASEQFLQTTGWSLAIEPERAQSQTGTS